MRRSPIRMLWPSSIELWYIAFISLALIALGNGKLILQKAGLIGSAHLIGQQVSTRVLWGNSVLTSFNFSANASSLIVWGATGLIIYSILQALVQALRDYENKRDFDTNRYVHPRGFTHRSYWRQIISDSVLGFILLALLVVAAYVYVAVVIPDSFTYVHRFVLAPSLSSAPYLPLSLVIIFLAGLIVYIFLKLVIRHHRIAAFESETS